MPHISKKSFLSADRYRFRPAFMYNLYMHNTVLTDAYRGELYLARAAAASGAVSGIRIMTLSSLLGEESDPEEAVLLAVSRTFRSRKEEYPVYGDMFGYPAFFSEILSFARECILYGIRAEDLPEADGRERELKRIIAGVLETDLAEKRNTARREERIAAAAAMENLSMIPGFPSDVCHAGIWNRLREFIPVVPMPECRPAKRMLRADNPCREIEAIAQDIVRRQLPCIVILTAPASQMPVLREVFARYRIPFSCTGEQVPSAVHRRFALLVRAALRRDAASLFACIRSNAFSVPFPGDLFGFLEETMDGISPDGGIHRLLEECAAFAGRASSVAAKEARTAAWFQSVRQETDLLFSAADPAAVLRAAFEIIRRSPLLSTADGMKDGRTLRSVLQECMPEVRDADDVLFLLQQIEGYMSSRRETVTSFCTVTDLRHPVDPARVSYVAGCSGTDYPGFRARSGLFDEQYTARVPGYPSLAERHAAYMDALRWIGTSASDEILYSCACRDLQGREIQTAYELEAAFGRNGTGTWPLTVRAASGSRPHAITPETAMALYIDHDTVTGSVSTIERWFACPYSWFLQSGLGLRKDEIPDADAAGIGTIQHAVMETALNRLHKDYAGMDAAAVRDVIHPCFEVLRALHPGRKELLSLSEERMHRSLMKALSCLSAYEKHTSFVPAEAEYRFQHAITDHVILRGTIDRIDFFGPAFRIIDYKSSEHSLSPTAIAAGTQLQLLSYLIAAAEITGRTPYGAYYFSLKEPGISLPAAMLTGRGKNRETVRCSLDEGETEAAIRKARMLKGATYTDNVTAIDDDGSFVSMPRGDHSYEKACEVIHTLYEYFYQEISRGSIAAEPLEDACTFCDFRTVCRHRGSYRRRPTITDTKGV